MASDRIDTRRLTQFLAVLDAGGVREASRRIHVAQPALSRTLAELEDELGLPLFERAGRRLVPTEAGRRVADDARVVLAEVEALVHRARRLAGGDEGRLRIGISPSATFNPLVPAGIRAFRSARPRVAVELVERASRELVEAVRGHVLDLAFVRLGAPLDATLRATPLVHERLVAVVDVAHPLARNRRVSFAKVLEHPLLLPPESSGSSVVRVVEDAARELGVPITLAATASHAASLVHLAATGMGAALVPESVASMRTRGVRVVAVQGAARLTLAMVTRSAERVPAVLELAGAMAARRAT